MSALSLIDASKLRMIHIRVAHLEVDVPDVRKLTRGGEVGIETNILFEICGDDLIVTPTLSASIKSIPAEQDGENEESEDAGLASVKYVATYSLPEGHNLEDGDVSDLQPRQADTFVHALQPILVTRLKSLLQETGAINPRIPPHIYVPDTAEPVE